MKRNQKGAKQRRQTLQLWSYAQARTVLSYVASIMRSLREYHLEAQVQHRRAQRLDEQPGLAGRTTLIAMEEAKRAARRAEANFREALHELQSLDIYCIDPLGGVALIPFVHDKQLAWFVFDLFDEEPLRFWRYHSDPLETRRPLAEMEKQPADQGTWLA